MVSFTEMSLEHAGDIDQVLQRSEADESTNVSKTAKHQEPVFLTTPTEKRCNRRVRLEPSKPSPIIVSTPVTDATNGIAGIENRIRELVENLKGTSPETTREATFELRMLAKDDNNRILIASCKGINPLVELLYSPDLTIQEHAVTALLNLSISDNNKIMISNSEAIDLLIHVLQTGNPNARENSAATLSSLSKFEEIKIRIGKCGAIGPLVELLENGSPQGKKDATTALFNLSTANENIPHIVRACALEHLINLMDPAIGMVDRATVVIANVATISEGRAAIAQAGGDCGDISDTNTCFSDQQLED